MRFDSLSADAVGQVDFVVYKAGNPNVAPLAPWRKDPAAVRRAAAMLAFAPGLLVAALGAGANEPARPHSTAERAGTDSVRVQPTARQFAPPNQPDLSASDARTVDELYRLLIGPPPATSSSSRLRAAPNDNSARSARRRASPRWG
jgi:hypothetical protein